MNFLRALFRESGASKRGGFKRARHGGEQWPSFLESNSFVDQPVVTETITRGAVEDGTFSWLGGNVTSRGKIKINPIYSLIPYGVVDLSQKKNVLVI